MPTLLHLNGPSGVGKSTLARAHAARHPGTLLCDIDELRSWVSGWEDDFVGTGEAVRAGERRLAHARGTVEVEERGHFGSLGAAARGTHGTRGRVVCPLLDTVYLDVETNGPLELRVACLPALPGATARWTRT